MFEISSSSFISQKCGESPIFIYLFIFYLFIYLYIYLLTYLSIYSFIYLFIYLFIYIAKSSFFIYFGLYTFYHAY